MPGSRRNPTLLEEAVVMAGDPWVAAFRDREHLRDVQEKRYLRILLGCMAVTLLLMLAAGILVYVWLI